MKYYIALLATAVIAFAQIPTVQVRDGDLRLSNGALFDVDMVTGSSLTVENGATLAISGNITANGATISPTELGLIDGITAYGQSLIDDPDAAAARITLGVAKNDLSNAEAIAGLKSTYKLTTTSYGHPLFEDDTNGNVGHVWNKNRGVASVSTWVFWDNWGREMAATGVNNNANNGVFGDAFFTEVSKHPELGGSYPGFGEVEILDFGALVTHLSTGASALSTYLWSQFAAEDKAWIVDEGEHVTNRYNALIYSLDSAIKGPLLYEPSRFSGVVLNYALTLASSGFTVGRSYQIVTPGTTDWVAIGAANNSAGTIFTATGTGSGTGTAVWTSATGADLRLLNRLLLDDAYVSLVSHYAGVSKRAPMEYAVISTGYAETPLAGVSTYGSHRRIVVKKNKDVEFPDIDGTVRFRVPFDRNTPHFPSGVKVTGVQTVVGSIDVSGGITTGAGQAVRASNFSGLTASGTNSPGTETRINGSQGTGSGPGGGIVFYTAPAGASGSTPNLLVPRWGISPGGTFYPITDAAVAFGTDTNRPTEVKVAWNFVKPIRSVTFGSNTIVQFSGSTGQAWQTMTLGGDVSFTGSNYAAGREVTLLLTGGGADYTLTFDANWKFVGGAAPATLAAGKKAKVVLQSWGTTASDVVVDYRVQP